MPDTIIAKDYFTPYFLKWRNIDETTEYEVEYIDASELLVPERIDLICKLYYIKCREENLDLTFAKELYTEHIKAFSDGTFAEFTEPGSEEKNTIQKYFDSFDKLIDAVKNDGFDYKKSVVPVSDKGVILDGAHRTAVAIYFGLKLPIVKTHNSEANYNYAFFKANGLLPKYLDFMAYEYVLKSKKTYVACIWPRATIQNKNEIVDALVSSCAKVVYKKEVALSLHGLEQLMVHLYHHQEWTGNADNCFSGVYLKANDCAENAKTIVYVLEGVTDEQILQLKAKIREEFNVENHSVHITDTKDEAIEAAQVLLNDNSVNALNKGNPYKFKKFFKDFFELERNGDKIYKTASLSIFGLKNIQNFEVSENQKLNQNPQNYFYYHGKKILALETIETDSLLLKLRINLLKNKPQKIKLIKKKKPYKEKESSAFRRFLAEFFENNKIGLLFIKAYRKIRYDRKPKKHKNIENLGEIFEKLSKTSNYLILRNFEGFYDDILLPGHNDIDLLCADEKSREKIVKALDAKDVTYDGYHYSFIYKGHDVELDTRMLGDGYYDASWQLNMLNNKVKHEKGFYIMNKDDYFYSLAYHAIYQKKTGLSDEYKKRLEEMKPEYKGYSQDDYIKLLHAFMKENGYFYTNTKDESVVRCFERVPDKKTVK